MLALASHALVCAKPCRSSQFHGLRPPVFRSRTVAFSRCFAEKAPGLNSMACVLEAPADPTALHTKLRTVSRCFSGRGCGCRQVLHFVAVHYGPLPSGTCGLAHNPKGRLTIPCLDDLGWVSKVGRLARASCLAKGFCFLCREKRSCRTSRLLHGPGSGHDHWCPCAADGAADLS